MHTFYLKIDDDQHSLSKENGLSIGELAKLLDALNKVIDPKDGSKCTLSEISGNCYQAKFEAQNATWYNRFEVAHKNLDIIPTNELKDEVANYAKTLKVILGGNRFLEAKDENKNTIIHLRAPQIGQVVDSYFVTKEIIATITGKGAKSLKATKLSFTVDEEPYRIYTTPEQDVQLEPHYRKNPIVIKLNQKRSLLDDRVISAELISFHPISNLSARDGLDKLKGLDITFLD